MNMKNIILILSVIILILILPVNGQDPNSSLSNNSNLTFQTPLTQEDMINEAQTDIDRSIDILNIVSTMITVLAALIAIFITIGAFFGFSEIWKMRKIRKETDNYRKEIQEYSEKIKPLLKSIEKKKNELDNNIEHQLDIIMKKPDQSSPGKIEDLKKEINNLEAFGIPIEAEDNLFQAIDLYYNEKYELSLASLEKAISLNPNYAKAWSIKGIVLKKLNRYNEALYAYDESLKMNPNDANTWYNRAITLRRLDRVDEAIKSYDKAIQLHPQYGNAWYNKACLFSIKGDAENALKSLKIAIEINPENKIEAKKDKDFESLWETRNFEKIIK